MLQNSNLAALMTLAEKFAADFAKIGNSNVHVKIKALCDKYNLLTISELTSNGVPIGKRYIFNDSSFCDFYLEANTKIFTGINSSATN